MSTVSEQQRRFVDRISLVRIARNLSQQDLADAIGLSRQAVSRIEVHSRGLSLGEALAVCEVLAVPLDAMISPEPLVLSVSVAVE